MGGPEGGIWILTEPRLVRRVGAQAVPGGSIVASSSLPSHPLFGVGGAYLPAMNSTPTSAEQRPDPFDDADLEVVRQRRIGSFYYAELRHRPTGYTAEGSDRNARRHDSKL
jgi:hypothetical protein